MIGCLWTRDRKQPFITLYFESKTVLKLYNLEASRPLAGYGLPPPPRGNLVDHIFLKARCLARILQHVSPLTMAALSCNSMLHTLLYEIFDNEHSF